MFESVLAGVAREIGTIDAAALDALAGDELADAVVEVHRLRAQIDWMSTRLTGALDRDPDALGNAHSAVPWVAWRCRVPKHVAKRERSNARALRTMPDVDAAFQAGEITGDHVRVLAAAHRANPTAFGKSEEELLTDAREHRYDVFHRRVTYWRQEADPDGVEDEAQDRFERRRAFCSETFEGTVQIDALLDPVGGGIFANELRRLEQELFDADWREARARRGEDAIATDLLRTPAQRRADAMALMAERSAAMPADATRGRILLQVLVGYETFAGRICELADGTVLTPGEAVSLLDDADVQRVVFGGPSSVLDVGARTRLFKGATRTAVELRDLECQGHPSCDVRFDRCEADHVQPYEWGGPTVQANGKMKCKWHHRRRRRAP